MRLICISILLIIAFCCRKESFTTSPDALLQTNVDTLHFDTVFTTTGSVTQSFKIVNSNSEHIRISSVRLAGGNTSPFKINVDGVPGPEASNIEVSAKDSIYSFVSVSINPSAANLPFVVRDSIAINYNGNLKWIQLVAFGQNARFLRNKEITSADTWDNELPYVILGGLIIQENAQLTINKGSRIYVHADAPIIVRGSLRVQGEKWDSTRVIITGDRLDEPYRNFPAGWPGIIFLENSRNNYLQYATIKNAYQAIVVTEPSQTSAPKLVLNEIIIDNAYDAGIIGINTSITAQNLLVSNCGKNVVLVKGGNYVFKHCTVAAVSNNYIQHKNPVLFISNFISQNNVVTSANLSALFQNCIFWSENTGIVEDEVVVAKNGNTAFNVTFDHVLWRVKTAPANANIIAAINDQPPLFDSINTAKRIFDFRLKAGSPAINKGVNTGIFNDLDGNIRPIGLPDLGAYERQ